MENSPRQALTKQEQYWLEHSQQVQKTQQPLIEYAQEHSLNLKAFYNYRSKLRKKQLLEPSVTQSFVKTKVSIVNQFYRTVIHLPNGIRIETEYPSDKLADVIKSIA